MKRLHFFTFFLLLLLSSCDNIPLEDIEQSRNNNNTSGQQRTRKVLLEYYTGHTCGNCPGSGGVNLNQLSALYPNQLVALAVHAGFFARARPAGQPFDYDFRTAVGNSLDGVFGVSSTGTPKGLINRNAYNGSLILTPSAWSSAVASYLSDSALVGIGLTKTYNAITRELTLNATFTAFENLSFPVRVAAYLVEDSVVNWQRDYTQTPEDTPDYTHRFVIRSDLVPAEGAQLSNGSQNMAKDFAASSFTATISNEYQDRHCKAIVIVYRQDSGEVLQCETVSLLP